jgi:hypothetical protein
MLTGAKRQGYVSAQTWLHRQIKLTLELVVKPRRKDFSIDT